MTTDIFFGFNWPDIFLITPWHALASVLTPILLTYLLFPESREVPWIGKKTALFLTCILLALAGIFFMGPARVAGTPTQLVGLLGAMGILVWHAKSFPGVARITDPVSPVGLKPVFYGAGIFFPSVALFSIAGARISPFIFLLLAFCAVWFYKHALQRNAWLTTPALALFGVGSYMQTAFIGIIITLTAGLPPSDLILPVGIVAEIALLLVSRKIIRISQEELFMAPGLSKI
jgi:hypothetical protein